MFGTSITLHASGDFIPIAGQLVSEFAAKNGFNEAKRKTSCEELLFTRNWSIGGMAFFSISFREHSEAVVIQVSAMNTPPSCLLVDPCPGPYSFMNIIDDKGTEKRVNLANYILSIILSAYRLYAGNKLSEENMKLSLPYSEIAGIVSGYFGEDIKFEYGGNPSRLKATFHHLPLYLTIQSVNDNTVTVFHQIGRDAEMAIPGVLVDPYPRDFFLTGMLRVGCQKAARKIVNGYLDKKVKAPFAKTNDDGTVSICLEQIDALHDVIKTVRLQSIEFDETGATISLSFE